MYKFSEMTDNGVFFRFPKALIHDRIWSGLPHAAQAVFPAIGCFANKDGVAFPGEDTLATVCGCAEQTVRTGVSALKDLPNFRIEKYVTKRGRWAKRFSFSRQPSESKEYFAFHRRIIDGGNWAETSPTAKALFPVMRAFGFWCPNDDAMEDDDEWDNDFESDNVEIRAAFARRTFDLCEADPKILADLAGIAIRSLPAALANLTRSGLIEHAEFTEYRWKVFIHPPKCFDRDYLNTKHQPTPHRDIGPMSAFDSCLANGGPSQGWAHAKSTGEVSL